MEVTDHTYSFPVSERPKLPLPGKRWIKFFKAVAQQEDEEEARAKPGSCAHLGVIPELHVCLPEALNLQLPTLNLREQQNTKAIFSAGLRAELQAGENEIRDPLSVMIQQPL